MAYKYCLHAAFFLGDLLHFSFFSEFICLRIHTFSSSSHSQHEQLFVTLSTMLAASILRKEQSSSHHFDLAKITDGWSTAFSLTIAAATCRQYFKSSSIYHAPISLSYRRIKPKNIAIMALTSMSSLNSIPHKNIISRIRIHFPQ